MDTSNLFKKDICPVCQSNLQLQSKPFNPQYDYYFCEKNHYSSCIPNYHYATNKKPQAYFQLKNCILTINSEFKVQIYTGCIFEESNIIPNTKSKISDIYFNGIENLINKSRNVLQLLNSLDKLLILI